MALRETRGSAPRISPAGQKICGEFTIARDKLKIRINYET